MKKGIRQRKLEIPLLPEGRIFGQITRKRAKKIFMAGENWSLYNGKIWLKVAEKRPQIIFTII
jgi:hypothetical protein